MKENDIITLAEVCDILSISVATGRNWIKSGILNPINESNEFYRNIILKIKEDIENNTIDRLNKRRNKKHVSGNFIPKKYIESSNGIKLVELIISGIEEELNDEIIKVIIAEYALKFYYYYNNYQSQKILLRDFNNKDKIYEIVRNFLNNSGINYEKVEKIIEKNKKIFEHSVFKLEDDVLGLLYMSLASTADRKQNGVYYTPTKVVSYMVNKVEPNISLASTIIDPCCGTGNFLIEFIKRGHDVENIYGRDIEETSIFIARMNTIIFSKVNDSKYDVVLKNIKVDNSLFLIENQNSFDVCIGNPPWGSELDDESVIYSNNYYETYADKGLEAFSLFIELGVKIIKNNGLLSYIVPETFFNVQTHLPIRQVITRESNITDVKYWGNVFDGVLAPALSFIAKKGKNKTFGVGANITNTEGINYIIGSKRKITPDNWNFNISDKELTIIQKIENSHHNYYLRDNADFALGIVTGNNKQYLKDTKISDDYLPIIKGSDVFKFSIKEAVNYIQYTPEKFQQVARNNLYFEDEKLIYRFISDTLVFAYDNNKTLSLNSANVVVPRIEELNIKYILGVLNSRLAHFYFKLSFNSIKILRNHIESIPLRKPSSDAIREIIHLVDLLILENDDKVKVDLYDKLNNHIYQIYELNNDEIDVIEKFNSGNVFLY